MPTSLRRALRTVLASTAIAGCAGIQPPPVSQAGATASEPLAHFASARIMALPTQMLRTGDSLDWSGRIADPGAYLAAADSAIERELRARNYGTNWVFPPDLIRSAKRNPTYVTDPTAIRAGDAARRLERSASKQLAEPVASQLRVLAGLHDVRYALVPVELRFERGTSGAGRAVLHLALLDVRGARLDWAGDVASDDASSPSSALFPSLARHVADLIAAR